MSHASIAGLLVKNFLMCCHAAWVWHRLLKKHPMIKTNAAVLIPCSGDDGFYALLYMDELIRSRNYKSAVILTPCSGMKEAAMHFSKKISEVVQLSEKHSKLLIQYFTLCDFDGRLIIASVDLPVGRNGSALTGIKGLSAEEIFAVGVYRLYPPKKTDPADLRQIYDAATLKCMKSAE